MRFNSQNFIWQDKEREELVSPFVHLFMFVTLAVGVCFVIFPDASGSTHSSLYILTVEQTAQSNTYTWGYLALFTPLLALAAFNFRQRWLSFASSMLGFLVWLFAAIIYGIGGFWFGVFIVAAPNLMFWVWLFIKNEGYYKRYG